MAMRGLRRRKGATAVGYGLLVGLIAVASLAALAAMGVSLADIFGSAKDRLDVATGAEAGFSATVSGSSGGTDPAITVAISLSRATADGGAATLDVATVDGPNTVSGTDYTPIAQTLTFSGTAAQTQTLALQVHAPAMYGGPARSVVLQLRNASANAKLFQDSLTIPLPDTAPRPVLGFDSAAPLALQEGAAPVTVVLTMAPASAAPVTVRLALTSPDNSAGEGDLALSATEVTLPALAQQATVTLAAPADGDEEPEERALLSLQDIQGADAGIVTRQAVIAANGEPPVLQLTQVPPLPVAEGATVELGLQLSGATWRTVTAPYAAADVDTDATDYTVEGGASGSLDFAPGETHKTLPIQIASDPDREADERFSVTLGTPQNATLDPQAASGTITVAANGVEPQLALSAASTDTLAEGGAAATMTLTLSARTFEPVQAVLQLVGSAGPADLELRADGQTASFDGEGRATVTIAAGSTSLDLQVAALADGIYEGGETASLTLLSAVHAVAPSPDTPRNFTLTDGDTPPVASLSGGGSMQEGGSRNLTVALSGPAGFALQLPLSLSGDASGGFAQPPQSVTVAAGETQAEATFTGTGADDIYSGNRSATVSLGDDGSGHYTLGSQASAQIDIADSLAEPRLTLAAIAASVAEDAGSLGWTVVLDHGSSQPVTVNWAIAGSGSDAAALGSDVYFDPPREGWSGTLTFQPGQPLAQSVVLTLADDSIDEPDEALVLTLSDPQTASLDGSASAAISIIDNDAAPTVGFADTGTPAAVAENGTVTLRVALSNPSAATVTVPFALTGSAQPGSDYTLLLSGTSTPASSPLSFAPGTTAVDLVLHPLADSLYEGDESFAIALETPQRATLTADSAARSRSLTVSDGDAPPAVTVTPTENVQTVEEGSSLTLTLSLGILAAQDTHLPFTFPGGTATLSAADYDISPATGVLVIPAGQPSGTVTVTAKTDALYEGSETGVFMLQPTAEATLPGDTAARRRLVTVADKTAAPVATISGGGTMTEGGSRTLTVTLTPASALPTTVAYAIAGSGSSPADPAHDFQNPSSGGTILIPAGAPSASLVLTGKAADATYSGTREATVSLAAGSGYSIGSTGNATAVSVQDSLAVPKLSIDATAGTSVAEGVGTTGWTVRLDHASSAPVQATWTLTGSGSAPASVPGDIGPANGTVAIAAGATTATIAVQVVDDNISEPTEQVQVALSAPSGATLDSASSTVLDIADNDGTPTVYFSSTATPAALPEAAGSASFTVALSNPSSVDTAVTLSIAGSASSADYTLSPSGTTVTISAGSTSVARTIQAVQDSTYEGNQTVVLTLASVSGNAALTQTTVNLTRSFTITDDDAAPVLTVARVGSGNVAGGSTATFRITKTGATELVATANWAVAYGESDASDFTGAVSGSVSLASTETTRDVTVTATTGSGYKQLRAFQVGLSSPGNASLGSPSSAGASIAARGTAPNCKQILHDGTGTASGTYTVQPTGYGAISVYCDMTTDGGGWTLVARSLGQSRDISANWGCNGDTSSAAFSWTQATGSLGDSDNVYSLAPLNVGLRFTQMLFGQRGSGNAWGSWVYRHNLPGGFDTGGYAGARGLIYTPAAVIGGNGGFGMANYVGLTSAANIYYMRDVDGDGFGLQPNGWHTCYGWFDQDIGQGTGPSYGGNINGDRGMIMVR